MKKFEQVSLTPEVLQALIEMSKVRIENANYSVKKTNAMFKERGSEKRIESHEDVIA